MAYIINPDSIALFTIKGKLFGQEVMTTHHYRYSGAVIADGADFLVNTLGANPQWGLLYAAWIGAISRDVQEVTMLGQWIYPTRFRPVKVTDAITQGALGGTTTGNIAQVVSLLSTLAGRTGVANKHLPGLPNTGQIEGSLTAGQRVLLNTYGDAARTPLSTAGGSFMFPVVYHRAAPGASRVVELYTVNPYVRTQRRRTVGLGK